MKHKIAQIIIMIFVVIITCILLFACGSKSTKVQAEPSHADSYELYVLDSFTDGKPRFTLYNTYKVKPKNINTTGNIITTYNATDGTQIIFANNGVTVISPKGYEESFTQGYMKITMKVLVKAV